MNNFNIVILKNDKYSTLDCNLPKQYILNKSLIALNIAPTYNYMRKEESDYNFLGDIKMQFKENKGSKYNQIKELYEKFEKVASYDTCLDGCESICCKDIFYISEMEFLYILAEYFKKNKFIELWKIYKKAIRQKNDLKENFEPIFLQVCDTYKKKDSRFYNLGMSVILNESCPFLNECGRCSCYDSRPVICRLYGISYPCSKGNMKTGRQKDIANILHQVPNTKIINQFRPIWYYIEHYLSKNNLKETMKIIKDFVETDRYSFKEVYSRKPQQEII